MTTSYDAAAAERLRLAAEDGPSDPAEGRILVDAALTYLAAAVIGRIVGADRDGFATAFAGARFAGHAAVAVGAGVAVVDDGALHAGPAVSTSLAVAF